MHTDIMLEQELVRSLCEIVDSPRSLTVYLLVKYGEWQQLVDLSCDASHYEDSFSFMEDYQVTEMLNKTPNLPLGVDRKRAAHDSFLKYESECRSTNDRLYDSSDPRIARVAEMVHCTLGPLTQEALEFIEGNFRFGPGATTGVKGRGSVKSDKYDEQIHLTPELYPFYKAILGERWWDQSNDPIVVEGNKFATVPKNAKTDRGICIEPTLNSYVQLGIGAYIRRMLKRSTVDLNTQDVNRELAANAHDWSLATLDLSGASDSLSVSAVFRLLDPAWFELLDLARSPKTLIDGTWVELEKFSSMGNGYTFELETLIFVSIAKSIVPRELWTLVNAYGDDIIVPREYAQEVIDALEFFGFSVNTQKSFLAGNFFESCGTDWFRNQNVRPFYCRGNKDEIPYALQLANSLRLWLSRKLDGQFCERRFKPLWEWLVGKVPSRWRLTVPVHFGDVGIITDLSEARNVKRCRDGWEGWMVKYVFSRPVYKCKTTFGRLLTAIARSDYVSEILRNEPAGLSPSFEEDSPTIRDAVFTYGREPIRGFLGRIRTKTAAVSQWPRGFQWTAARCRKACRA